LWRIFRHFCRFFLDVPFGTPSSKSPKNGEKYAHKSSIKKIVNRLLYQQVFATGENLPHLFTITYYLLPPQRPQQTLKAFVAAFVIPLYCLPHLKLI